LTIGLHTHLQTKISSALESFSEYISNDRQLVSTYIYHYINYPTNELHPKGMARRTETSQFIRQRKTR